MRRFEIRQIRESVEFALAGGQALHVWTPSPEWKSRPSVPLVFRRANLWAHLFDQDAERLVTTARQLGVKVIALERRGTRHQHIDLCGKPLERALKLCE